MPFGEAAPCRLPSANPAQTAAGQLQGSALSPGTCAALLDALHTVNSSSLCFALCPTPPRSFFAAKPAAGGGAPAATQHGDEQERSNGGEGGAKKAKTGMIPPCSRQSKTSTRELCTTTRCGKLHAPLVGFQSRERHLWLCLALVFQTHARARRPCFASNSAGVACTYPAKSARQRASRRRSGWSQHTRWRAGTGRRGRCGGSHATDWRH